MEKPKREIKLLIGLSGYGKSTYLKNHAKEFENYTILLIDEIAKARRDELQQQHPDSAISMDYVFTHEHDAIYELFDTNLQKAVASGDNILIDRNNGLRDDRTYRIGIAKQTTEYNYKSTAIVIHPPEESEHVDRLVKRSIADNYFAPLNDLHIKTIEPIQSNEFDEVIHTGNLPAQPLFHEYKSSTASIMDLLKPPNGSARKER